MSAQPPPIPLKYKMATPQDAPTPKRVAVLPPKAPPRSHWEALFRIGVVLVMVLSVSLAYWSFFHRLLPLQKQARSTLTKVSAMSSRLDEMEQRWTPEQAEKVRGRYREAYAELFTTQSALEEWLGEVKAPASWLALDVRVVLGQSTLQASPGQGLTIIPVSLALEVKPQPLDTQALSPYERVLGFNQLLARHGKRADLAEMTVNGGVGSIQRADLVFNLWAGEPVAEAESSAATTASNQGTR